MNVLFNVRDRYDRPGHMMATRIVTERGTWGAPPVRHFSLHYIKDGEWNMEGTFLTTAEWLYPIVQKMVCFRQRIMNEAWTVGNLTQNTRELNSRRSCSFKMMTQKLKSSNRTCQQLIILNYRKQIPLKLKISQVMSKYKLHKTVLL